MIQLEHFVYLKLALVDEKTDVLFENGHIRDGMSFEVICCYFVYFGTEHSDVKLLSLHFVQR